MSICGLVGDAGSPKKLIVAQSEERQHLIDEFNLSEIHRGERLTAIYRDITGEPILLIDQDQQVIHSNYLERRNKWNNIFFMITSICVFGMGVSVAKMYTDLTPAFLSVIFIFSFVLTFLWDYRDKLSEL